jgi:hypothetical protein
MAKEEYIYVKYREGQDLKIPQRKFARETTDNLKMTVFWKQNLKDETQPRSRVNFVSMLSYWDTPHAIAQKQSPVR